MATEGYDSAKMAEKMQQLASCGVEGLQGWTEEGQKPERAGDSKRAVGAIQPLERSVEHPPHCIIFSVVVSFSDQTDFKSNSRNHTDLV